MSVVFFICVTSLAKIHLAIPGYTLMTTILELVVYIG